MKTPEEIKKGLEYMGITDVAEKVEKFKKGMPFEYTEEVAADAIALIQQLEAKVPKWISVEEQLPEENQKVLVYTKQGMIMVGDFSFIGKCGTAWFRNGRGKSIIRYSATHWMPLPEPPKEEENHATD